VILEAEVLRRLNAAMGRSVAYYASSSSPRS
jgi:hypothetical protein